MGILYSHDTQTFHLSSRNTSLVLQVVRGQYLATRYWGQRVNRWSDSCGLIFHDRPFFPSPDPEGGFSLDALPQAFGAWGTGDFRTPVIEVGQPDGSTLTALVYQSHRIRRGKIPLPGLPSLYVESDDEADSLDLVLFDEKLGLEVTLTYTVFTDLDILTRSVSVFHRGPGPLTLLRVMSASFDFEHSQFESLQLAGSWARERHIVRQPLVPGLQSWGSTRGASSHQHNPFIALVTPGTDEDTGEVWAMNLVYSGNFLAFAEVDSLGGTRLALGINPFGFAWNLAPGETFQAPEAVMGYSAEGLGGMSRRFHQAYRTRLCRGLHRDRERPVLVNNWEATYFDFNEEKILALADEARDAGIELLVLDDGWFGHRDNDRTSLGDWVVHQAKLPRGLKSLAEGVRARGLGFGLWFEPEMISPDSDLYRAHPDWCLHVPGRPRTESRHQLVLDLTRAEVRQHIVNSVSTILGSVPVSYVKWDMNRHYTEVGSALLPAGAQKETFHRYILGLYEVLDAVTRAFPEVLFESCSGGGGRFDPGILAYMPQTWTSDNTDAVSRLKIQYGTSLVYPPVTMGAHVSAVPNHQVGRTTPFGFRGAVAMGGNLGYELDLGRLTSGEKEAVKDQVATYKRLRKLVQFGDFYRLVDPFASAAAAWMFVAPDRGLAWATYFVTWIEANRGVPVVRLKGLDPEARYRWVDTGQVFGGDELMRVGVRVYGIGSDCQSCSWVLERVA